MARATAKRADTTAPALSPRLRPHVRALSADAGDLAQRMFDAVRDAVPEYRAIRDEGLLREVLEMVRVNVDVWYRSLLTGSMADEAALAPIASFARRRFHQHIPLAALLHSFRVGATVMWQGFLEGVQQHPAVRDEVLLKLSPHMLRHTDLLGQTISRAYADEQRRGERWQTRLRYELCSIVFDRPGDVDGFGQRARELGIDPLARRVALAFRPEEARGVGSAEDDLDALQRALGRGGTEASRPVGTLHHGQVVIWVAVPAGESAIHHERRLDLQLAQLVGKRGVPARAGIGLAGAGPQGWRLSAEQAMRGLEIGRQLADDDRVCRYSDYVLDDAALGSRNVAGYLDGLLELIASEPQLVETLDIWFRLQRQRKAVAAALAIHPNTLGYRLKRIETLLRADLGDVSWQSRLSTALRTRRIARASG